MNRIIELKEYQFTIGTVKLVDCLTIYSKPNPLLSFNNVIKITENHLKHTCVLPLK